jgi:hypothetical protein
MCLNSGDHNIVIKIICLQKLIGTDVDHTKDFLKPF